MSGRRGSFERAQPGPAVPAGPRAVAGGVQGRRLIYPTACGKASNWNPVQRHPVSTVTGALMRFAEPNGRRWLLTPESIEKASTSGYTPSEIVATLKTLTGLRFADVEKAHRSLGQTLWHRSNSPGACSGSNAVSRLANCAPPNLSYTVGYAPYPARRILQLSTRPTGTR